jgi:ABC-type uncharacterized transport system involved in gliding motility auxiliary subunit
MATDKKTSSSALLKRLTSTGSGLAVLAVAVVCLNVIAGKLFVRLDMTEDKVFSLSDGTEKILGKLDRDVTAKLFFSRSLKELPPVLKTYATRVEEVLNEYRTHSGGRLAVETVDPKPDTEDEELAQRYGISGVRLPKGDQMYFGIVFTSGAKETVIPYLDPRREEFLEYDLSEALVGLSRQSLPKIGVMASLPVMGSPAGMMGGEGGEPWVFVSDLKRNFDVQEVAADAKEIPSDLRLLIVLHPKNLSEATLYALDQFVVHGGRMIVAVDPMSRTDLQLGGAQARAQGQMPDASSSLDKLFAAWGVEFDKGNMVGDLSLATQINAGGPVVSYPYFMSLGEEQFTKESVVTGNLRQMLIAEGGALAQVKDSTYVFEPLLKTTKDSGTAGGAMAAFMMPQDLARELKVDDKERVVAAMVRGKFKSAFPGGKPAGGETSQSERPFKAEAEADVSVLVVADVDFLADANSADKMRFGSQTMVRVRNDNLNFLFNAADYLGGSEDLIAIRSRGRIARPFTKVQELQKEASVKWQKEEETLTAQLNDLQKRLGELQQARTDGNRLVLTTEQQQEIAKFRDEEHKIRQRRREVRKSLREEIESLGRRLTFVNLLGLPLAASVFGFGVFMKRGRRRQKESRHAAHG